MRRIRFSNGGSSCALLGPNFHFSNYTTTTTTSLSLKPKSFLKILVPSRTTPLFTTFHFRLLTTAQHCSPSHILSTPQIEPSIVSGKYPFKKGQSDAQNIPVHVGSGKSRNTSGVMFAAVFMGRTCIGGDGQNGVPMKDSKVVLKGMRYTELEKWAQSHGYRPAQALMLWKRLYGDNIWAQCSEELEGLNKDFRKMLSINAEFKTLELKDILSASDGTKKMLFKLEDGLVIETVVIPCEGGRNTVCISSQVGCAMNCQFCYTGRMGLKRNLSTSEIVEQAVLARRLLSSEVGSISNVVFMGMGEPLHNIENVIKAADILVDEQGLHFSPRKVTVSTSGLVPQLKRFLRESNCALAVSLNATTDEVRNWIMPINRKFNLNLLLGTLREELPLKHKYKVLFEYVMLAGVNDSVEDAKRLIDLVQGIPCKINLISFNPHSGSFFKPTKKEKIIEFRNILAEAGCVVLLRLSRGDGQMAACGQLGKPGEIRAPLLRVPSRFQTVLEAAA